MECKFKPFALKLPTPSPDVSRSPATALNQCVPGSHTDRLFVGSSMSLTSPPQILRQLGQPWYATRCHTYTSKSPTTLKLPKTSSTALPTPDGPSIRSTNPTAPPPGSQPQKGVTSYALSPNRQRPLAGTLHAAVFNVARRTRQQILFWLTPMVIAYAAMEWATEK